MERVADYIIRKINEAGVSHIYLVTGRGILYLTDAVAKNNNITPVSFFHEQGASYAAMAHAGINEGVACCLVSTGCAAANAVTACLCAYQDNLPVVFLSGNNFLDENTRHTGVNIRTYGSQEADIVSIVESITKYAVMIEDKEKVVYELEKALYYAVEGRKGPVWIDVPLDVQNMRIDDSIQEHFTVPSEAYAQDIYESKIESVVNDLNNYGRPVLLIGGGARSAGSYIASFVEKVNIPVCFSPSAADIYGSSHNLSMGAVGSIGGSRAGNFVLQNSDYILAVGTRLSSQLTGMKKAFAREAYITVIDIDENEHKKNGVPIDKCIKMDAKIFFEALDNYEIKEIDDNWLLKCQHWKEVFSLENEKFIRELKEKGQLDIYSVADIISDKLPDDTVVITDAGFEELIIPSAIRYKEGQRCIFPAAQGAMGYAIPAIIGVHSAGRNNIVCIVGDGSIMMNLQELQTIKSLNIPAKILVINNNMYAVIRKRQKDLFRNRTIGNDSSDGLSSPDFMGIAKCFGFSYRKICNRTDLHEYVKDSFWKSSLEIVEIMCVPDQQYFHESYGVNEKKRIVHRPIEDMAPFLERAVVNEEMIIDSYEG